VILLHGFKGNRKDLDKEDEGLAWFLQKNLGCAVIVPDLRGHGDSTKVRIANSNRKEDLKGKRLTPGQISAMVTQDLLAVKEFLWKKNNAKALNIDKLVVIGEEEGAAVALGFAAFDAVGYDQGQVSVGPLKLGRFVKAAVLISPPPVNIPALRTPQVMRMPEICQSLPVMIVMGNKSKEYFTEAERLRTLFIKARPPAVDAKPESITVWYFNKIDTPLQGAKLMAEPSLKVSEKVLSFLQSWVVDNPDVKELVWKERKLPYE
jgi:pimeloyl-ACP methyl ester carboxylesterase